MDKVGICHEKNKVLRRNILAPEQRSYGIVLLLGKFESKMATLL